MRPNEHSECVDSIVRYCVHQEAMSLLPIYPKTSNRASHEFKAPEISKNNHVASGANPNMVAGQFSRSLPESRRIIYSLGTLQGEDDARPFNPVG